jgi:hypothetical protein
LAKEWLRHMNTPNSFTYPMLQEILKIKGLLLQSTYTIRDVAKIFNVSVRAIQNRVSSNQLPTRDLPGRAKFLPQDLEGFLVASKKGRARRDR